MAILLHDLLFQKAQSSPDSIALTCGKHSIAFHSLTETVNKLSNAINQLSLIPGSRIGIFLNKSIDNIALMLAASMSQMIFVPINSALKKRQVEHIIQDCDISLLITNQARYQQLEQSSDAIRTLNKVVLVDLTSNSDRNTPYLMGWQDFVDVPEKPTTDINNDGSSPACILYTSGSTGKAKGVVLSHQNLILGAQSVTQYLALSEKDSILAVLPLSFDYGLNQVISCFLTGAHCILLDYLLPRDVLKAVQKYKVTGLAAVPPLWVQLCNVDWSKYDTSSLRYFTNSGGVLEAHVLAQLRENIPNASPFLMYGLTEAFRSTYLPPAVIDEKPNSIGKAIPNATISIINEEGNECAVNEVGELVHTGPLVTLGYWNNQEKTQLRFRPSPIAKKEISTPQIAVWSGDFAYKDSDGYLYFVARKDEMIKTSGYRVSPNEVEEVISEIAEVKLCAVLGKKDSEVGNTIVAFIESNTDQVNEKDILKHCTQNLANYMVPRQVIFVDQIELNPNGKINRQQLKQKYLDQQSIT